jgi:hypothetical protein
MFKSNLLILAVILMARAAA